MLTARLKRSNQDIVNQAVLEVSDKQLYDVSHVRKPITNGALDPKLVSTIDWRSVSEYTDGSFA